MDRPQLVSVDFLVPQYDHALFNVIICIHDGHPEILICRFNCDCVTCSSKFTYCFALSHADIILVCCVYMWKFFFQCFFCLVYVVFLPE